MAQETFDRVLVVLPTYNESGTIRNLIRRILDVNYHLNILIVDDGSPDGTGKIADEMAADNPRVMVLHRQTKSGRGGAVIAGFEFAIERGYDCVIEMDADFSHSPDEIPSMLQAVQKADLVIASRFIKGGGIEDWNWKRKLIHFGADLMVKVILGTPNTDHTNGFRCYRLSKLKKMDLTIFKTAGYIGQTLMEFLFHRCGFVIKEVPSIFRNRSVGTSKMGAGEMWGGILAMVEMRKNVAMKGLHYYLSSDSR